MLGREITEEKYNINNLNKNLINEAKRLLPANNYVGFSLTQGNAYRKKSWSLNNFILLANELVKRKKTPVFFINENQKLIEEIKNKIPQALFPEKNANLNSPALVTALASRLDYAITIDNVIMHMMSIAEIPMIVLFGPTSSDKFAPKYNSIKILDTKFYINLKI